MENSLIATLVVAIVFGIALLPIHILGSRFSEDWSQYSLFSIFRLFVFGNLFLDIVVGCFWVWLASWLIDDTSTILFPISVLSIVWALCVLRSWLHLFLVARFNQDYFASRSISILYYPTSDHKQFFAKCSQKQ